MDEPAAGLNSRETAELALLIRKIRKSGVTVTLVEHDMELVMDICDSIIVLNLGKKLAEGKPREIQENPAVISAYLDRIDYGLLKLPYTVLRYSFRHCDVRKCTSHSSSQAHLVSGNFSKAVR